MEKTHNGRTADEWLRLAARLEAEGKKSHADLMIAIAMRLAE